ncbi:hypothetical protein [Poriferisphaera corsica]|nr:hypothetical protein [Poriferisphaera corsica]
MVKTIGLLGVHCVVVMGLSPWAFMTVMGLFNPAVYGEDFPWLLVPLVSLPAAIIGQLFIFYLTVPLGIALWLLHLGLWRVLLRFEEGYWAVRACYLAYWLVIGVILAEFLDAFASLEMTFTATLTAGAMSGLVAAGTVLGVRKLVRKVEWAMREKNAA